MNKTFIIAEAGVNHNGDANLACQLIDRAVEAGADAVKFQTFKAENLVTQSAQRADYQTRNMANMDESQFAMLKKLELRFEDFTALKTYCDQKKIVFLTTPFDFESADFIFDLVDVYKISSGEAINTPFLRHIARKGKPIILSTGMCTLGEVEAAISTINTHQPGIKAEFPALTLLHCTTDYPCPFEEVNLRAMITLREAFKLPVGYSDHTSGFEVSIVAAALGATVIEKHFTLDRNLPGPDHKASLEPHELKAMLTAIRHVEASLGNGIKRPTPSEQKIMAVARKSIVAKKNIKAGEILTESNLTTKRPGHGLSPLHWDEIIGRKALRDFLKDELID